MSKYGFIKVASVSPKTVVADPKKNASNAYISLVEASSSDIQLCVFPELYLSGYTCGDLFLQNVLIDSCLTALNWLLDKTQVMETAFVIGLPFKTDNRLYNCAAVCYKGKVLGIVPKTCLPDYGSYNEKRWFSSSLQNTKDFVTLGGKKIPFGKILFSFGKDFTLGVEIGSDLTSPVSPSTAMALSGADVIANLSAFSETVGESEHRINLIKAHSRKNLCAYIYSSAGHGESTTNGVFSGSCIIAECGKILSQSKPFSIDASFTSTCIDVEKINNERLVNTVFRDDSINFSEDKYETLNCSALKDVGLKAINRVYRRNSFVPSDEKSLISRCEEIFAMQSHALAKRLLHTKASKIVIGVSGGLDSTLALLVAANTMEMLKIKKKNIICVTMPGFGTTGSTKNNSLELIDAIGATAKIIDIKESCLKHFEDIEHDPNQLDVTYENAQARERTQILMDIANKENALLVGTGDLSELALGWCTYNGDHMSMYNVNCDIPKTLVRSIVYYLSTISVSTISATLKNILETPISPELLPPDRNGNIVQKTEDNIGPYELHDFFLYHFVRHNFSPEKILFIASMSFNKIYDNDVILNWLKVFIKRFFSSQFKRSCSPDGPKIGSVSLSPRSDWKMPSDAECSRWLEMLD